MTVINEYFEVAKWLYETLSTPAISGLSGGVWEHPAPANATYPLITFTLQTPKDVETVSHTRVWAEFLMLVTAIDQTESTTGLKTIANAIESRLQGAAGTTTDGRILSANREGGFARAEESKLGLKFRRVGGWYRVLAQPLSP